MSAGRLRRAVACSLVVLAITMLSASMVAAKPDSQQFFGVVPQGPISSGDLNRMEGVIGTLRIPILWLEVEPQPGVQDFERYDALVGAAAERGIRVMPFVFGTPSWIAAGPSRPPLADTRKRQAWSAFLRLLVDRYGPGGGFWKGRVERFPIRSWQIWNEPNFKLFWRPRPSPRGYARLLRISAGSIRSVDPSARIVAAGVAPVGGGFLPWVFLRRLYRVPGVRRSFDVAAVHPYATNVFRMKAHVRDARSIMDAAGDSRIPLLVSEFGVASQGTIPSAFVLGERGQERFVSEALRLLLSKRRSWRIAGVHWFAWRDSPVPDFHCAFCEGAGLLDREGAPKPAWWAFRRLATDAARGRVALSAP
jgi:Cellulase (glycosyl hydrolase family 5)